MTGEGNLLRVIQAHDRLRQAAEQTSQTMKRLEQSFSRAFEEGKKLGRLNISPVVSVDDRISSTLDRLLHKLTDLKKMRVELKLIMNDQAISTATKFKQVLDNLSGDLKVQLNAAVEGMKGCCEAPRILNPLESKSKDESSKEKSEDKSVFWEAVEKFGGIVSIAAGIAGFLKDGFDKGIGDIFKKWFGGSPGSRKTPDGDGEPPKGDSPSDKTKPKAAEKTDSQVKEKTETKAAKATESESTKKTGSPSSRKKRRGGAGGSPSLSEASDRTKPDAAEKANSQIKEKTESKATEATGSKLTKQKGPRLPKTPKSGLISGVVGLLGATAMMEPAITETTAPQIKEKTEPKVKEATDSKLAEKASPPQAKTSDLSPASATEPRIPEAAKTADSGGLWNKLKGGSGKALKWLGKAASKAVAPLGAAMTIADIATADNKVEAAVKSGASSIGGMIGAGIGTLVLPGVGTAIGGVIGGIAGDFVGSFAADKWFGNKKKEPDAPPPASTRNLDLLPAGGGAVSTAGPNKDALTGANVKPTNNVSNDRTYNVNVQGVQLQIAKEEINEDDLALRIGQKIVKDVRLAMENRV